MVFAEQLAANVKHCMYVRERQIRSTKLQQNRVDRLADALFDQWSILERLADAVGRGGDHGGHDLVANLQVWNLFRRGTREDVAHEKIERSFGIVSFDARLPALALGADVKHRAHN